MWIDISRIHDHRKNDIIRRWVKEFGPEPDVGASLAVDYWLDLDATGNLPKYLAAIAINRIIDGRSKYAL